MSATEHDGRKAQYGTEQQNKRRDDGVRHQLSISSGTYQLQQMCRSLHSAELIIVAGGASLSLALQSCEEHQVDPRAKKNARARLVSPTSFLCPKNRRLESETERHGSSRQSHHPPEQHMPGVQVCLLLLCSTSQPSFSVRIEGRGIQAGVSLFRHWGCWAHSTLRISRFSQRADAPLGWAWRHAFHGTALAQS
jgi:hypothetical protein